MGSSHSRSVQEREPSDRTRRPDLLQGTMGDGTGQGRNCQEQGPPRAGAIGSKSPNEQGPPVHIKTPALHQREEANRQTTQNHGGNKGEEDDMAEALRLSQMATTRERAEQRKAEFLEYRMMQDSRGSGQPRDRQERGWSSVPRGYRPAEMQPRTGQGRRDPDHAGQEALQPPAHLQDSGVKYGRAGRTILEPGGWPTRKSLRPPLL